MSNAVLQDNQWLASLPLTLGFDDLEIYFEDIADVIEMTCPENEIIEPIAQMPAPRK